LRNSAFLRQGSLSSHMLYSKVQVLIGLMRLLGDDSSVRALDLELSGSATKNRHQNHELHQSNKKDNEKMHTLKKSLLLAALAAASALASILPAEADPILKDGERLAIAGDSITEQRQYTNIMESYILLCSGLKDVKVFQFGWSGETAGGFANRMDNDVMGWKPTLITTCYGMNDGTYRAYEEKIGASYRQNMEKIVNFFKEKGVKVIVGTPGVVDTKTYGTRNNATSEDYNKNLEQLAQIDKSIAEANACTFADLHSIMMDTMLKAKAALGENYAVAGGDGIHPGPNGHLVMAYAFLKSMGFDGNIALIEMDWNGKATASEGHKVLASTQGNLELESSRYPFCFADNSPAITILPYVNFQQDLNRFVLKVKNLPSKNAELTWGDAKKTFSREELEKGVNLANEFLKNPFSAQFAKGTSAIAAKQNIETRIIRNFITQIKPQIKSYNDIFNGDADAKEAAEALNHLKGKLLAKQAQFDAKLREEIIPIKHTIKVSPIQ